MDMLKISAETGLFEVAQNIARIRCDPLNEFFNIPMPSSDIFDRVKQIAVRLAAFDKEKMLFLTPEIALIDELSEICSSQILFAVPCDLDCEARERLENNLPKNMNVDLLFEPSFPEDFYPSNAIFITCGYLGGGRAMVSYETYRLAKHYRDFHGKKVFVPYVETEYATHRNDWYELNISGFDEIWRYNDEHIDN